MDKADNVTHRVLFLVEGISWAEFYKPFWMPEPINATAFRPLSVLFHKGIVEVFGATAPPPTWLTLLKSVFSLWLFGWGARAWLVAVGYGRISLLAAISAMCLAPSLFQAWYLPELDLVGAGFTLGAGALLLREETLDRRAVFAVASLLTGAIFLKEATAIVQFSFLLAGVLVFWRRPGAEKFFRRHLLALVLSLGAWILLALPLFSSPSSDFGSLSLASKLPLVEHNLVQVLYLASPVAALLMALQLWMDLPRRIRRVVPNWCLPPLALLLLLGLPVAVFYSHYEAIYYSPRGYGTVLAAVLWFALLLRSTRIFKARVPWSTLLPPLTVAGATAGLSVAVLLGPSAREDMASRIFIAVAPLVLAMAWKALLVFWKSAGESEGWRCTVGRGSTGVLAASLAWYALASCLNFTNDWRTRHAVDFETKSRLATEDLRDNLLLFNHYVEWLDPLGLKAAGATQIDETTRFVQVPSWIEPEQYNIADWILPSPLHPLQEIEAGTPTWLYWMTPRSLMTAEANQQLEGDLSWTRRQYGLFSPVAHRTLIINGLRHRPHNRPEDHRRTIYLPGPSPLETLADTYGNTTMRADLTMLQVPTMLTEVPRRIFQGIPLVERYRYEAVLTRFNP